MEEIFNYLASANLPLFYIFLIAFAAPLIENLFPPAPGDTVLIILGTLIGMGKVGFISTLSISTLGSTVGFVAMFLLGKYLGNKIIDSNRFKFINEKSMRKPHMWFHKYGYLVIILNRFLSGTRAVISFLAGMSNMRLRYSIILAAISSLLWNGILIYLGYLFGENWRLVNAYIEKHAFYLFPIIILLFAFFIYRFNKNTGKETAEE